MGVVVNWLKNNNSRTSMKRFVDIVTALLLLVTFIPFVAFILILTLLYLWQSHFIYFKDVLNETAYEMLIVVLKNEKLKCIKIRNFRIIAKYAHMKIAT